MQLSDHSFQKWIEFFFAIDDEAAEDSVGKWIDSDWLSTLTAKEICEYTIATFENRDRVLSQFRGEQIGCGLEHILDYWNYKRCSFEDDRSTIRAMIALYKNGIFVDRCAPFLSHDDLNLDKCNEVNNTCYMWWDILWYSSLAFDREPSTDIGRECVEVMAEILEIEHIACQESALHGLGHWHKKHPELVTAIVDRFIETHPHLPADLKEYAEDARVGHML